jgi:trigger factor
MTTSTETPESVESPKLQLDIKVQSPSACVREVVVTIPKTEVSRYFRKAFDELAPAANLPGFRNGRVPRKLVEKQFRDQANDKVKNGLLVDSLAQVTDTDKFNAIGEPEFDYQVLKVSEDSDFTFQFQVEVRPEFKTPAWKGIKFEKPVETVGDAEVEKALDRVLARYAGVEATDEPAALGDKVLMTAKFSLDGKVISEMDEERITVAKRLSFSDAICENFGELLKGVQEDGKRSGKVKMSATLADTEIAGKEVDAEFSVIEVYKMDRPALTPEFLTELGDFESEQELRDFVRDSLTRQAEYRTNQAVRAAVVELLTESASFDLPEKLVRRQTIRELERKILELRRNGFDEDAIRGFVNASRRNAQASTEVALREHFILEQIAEEEGIDADEADYEAEVELIAQQSDMPARRVRARLERQGQMDALRNQIVERKVIQKIVENAKVTEKKVTPKEGDEHNEFAVYHNVVPVKNTDAIPEAKYDDKTPKGSAEEKYTSKNTEE